MLENLLKWDRETFIYLNNLGIERFDDFWSIVTNISTWIPLFILFFALLFWKNSRREGLIMSAVLVLLVIFVITATHLTKLYVARLRPSNDEEINTLIRILQSPTDYSFYSGHACSSFAITIMMLLFLRKKIKWMWVFFLWPILFSMSRIYVGVHFPIDIIVGALVGAGCAFVFYRLYIRFTAPYSELVRRE